MTAPTPKETEVLMLRMVREGILTDQLFRLLHHDGKGMLTMFHYLNKNETNTYQDGGQNQKLAIKLKELDEFIQRMAES